MKLIGMLDSPYVRRVAISLKTLDIPFEHAAISVFRGFEAFQAINPVVKAPTLVLDDGEVLMDSSLIIEYLEALSGPGNSLLPTALPQRQRALRLIGLALAACEKSVQIYYERNLRPEEKQHAPWLERVSGQLHAAYSALEQELEKQSLRMDGRLEQDGITLAVAWSFTQLVVPDQVDVAQFPRISEFTAYAEQLPAFIETPLN